MTDWLPDLLPELRAHSLPGLPLLPTETAPAYAGLSIANLPDSICAWLGAAPLGNAPLQPRLLNAWNQTFDRVILLVVDGLGLDWFQGFLEARGDLLGSPQAWQHLLADASLAPLTSVSPSTTSAALTTFWTGQPPAGHGVLGYELWLREYGLLANMILHTPTSFRGEVGSLRQAGFRADTFLPCPTLGPHLAAQGVKPYSLQHVSIAHSGLSQMLFAGCEVLPFITQSDLWVTFESLLASTARQRSYIYLYWGDLDSVFHRFSPEDERAWLEFAHFSQLLTRVLRKAHTQPGRTLFLMTADHGHVSTPPNPQNDLIRHPELLADLVMVPSGESRLPYLYVRPGREEHLRAYVETAWPGQIRLIPSQQALEQGLFGPPPGCSATRERIGDWLALLEPGLYWWWANRENLLRGRHGGLSTPEMLVPLFGLPL